jgi:hypothetical protein
MIRVEPVKNVEIIAILVLMRILVKNVVKISFYGKMILAMMYVMKDSMKMFLKESAYNVDTAAKLALILKHVKCAMIQPFYISIINVKILVRMNTLAIQAVMKENVANAVTIVLHVILRWIVHNVQLITI